MAQSAGGACSHSAWLITTGRGAIERCDVAASDIERLAQRAHASGSRACRADALRPATSRPVHSLAAIWPRASCPG